MKRRITSLLAAGDVNGAFQLNIQSLEKEPNDPSLLSLQSRIYFKVGQPVWAKNILNSIFTFPGVKTSEALETGRELGLNIDPQKKYGEIWETWEERERDKGEVKRFTQIALLCKGKVLEVGCGNGDQAYTIAALHHDVVGLDISLEGLKMTKRVKERCFPDRCHFLEGSGYQLPFPDNSFDTVVLPEVIEHITNPLPIFNEAQRVLRPGGRFIVSTPDRIFLPDGEHIRYFSRTTLSRTLLDAFGIEPTYVEHELYKDKFPLSHLMFFVDLPGVLELEQPERIDVAEVPLVSYIVPTFNRAHMIEDALQGLLNQTYPNIEIIVWNDGSTDNTREVMKKYEGNVRYYEEENQGKSSAMNTAIPLCRGNYIAIFDDDDIPFPDKTAVTLEGFRRYPDAGMVCTSGIVLDQAGVICDVSNHDTFQYGNFLQKLLIEQFCFLTSTMIVKKSVYENVGTYNPEYIFSEDVDMMVRICEHYNALNLTVPTMIYRKHEAVRGNKQEQFNHQQRLLKTKYFMGLIHKRKYHEIPLEKIVPQLKEEPYDSGARIKVLVDRLRSLLHLDVLDEAMLDLQDIVGIAERLGAQLPKADFLPNVQELSEKIVHHNRNDLAAELTQLVKRISFY